jgi:LacI family transcriptional regulator
MPENDSGSASAPTQRRVTIVDVARHAGVSTAAASKALRNAYGVSESMSERVQASIAALGYRPLKSARGMRGRTYTIGVMLSDIENPFFGLLIDGLSQVLRPQGFDFLVAPAGTSAESHRSIAATLADYQVDGLVLIAPRLSDSELEDIGAATPTAVLGRHGPATNYDTISGDDALGSALIVDHLVELGHRQIGFITIEEKGESPRTPQFVRAEGFVTAMKRHGLADSITMIPGEWSYAGGRSAANALLKMRDRPTALHAGADVCALGALDELLSRQLRVPGEISLAGYDNSPTAQLLPIGLTSIDQSGQEMGRVAARLLSERIKVRSGAQHVLMKPTLKIRKTTAPPE